MNNVYPVLDWMKANPLMVVCIVIIVASLGVFYVSHRESGEIRDTLSERERDISTLQNFRQTQVTAPGPDPDDPPLSLRLVANEGAIEQLREIYNDLENEFRGVYRYALELNQGAKEPMIEGLFPDPGPYQSLKFHARDAYAEGFTALYERLNAGSPPTPDELEDLLVEEREAMLRQVFLNRNREELTEEQEEELEERQRERLFRFLREHATNFRLFADPVELDTRGEWRAGPFHVGEWARATSGRPNMFMIWEGQKRLWIQQDLVDAILRANPGDDPVDSLLSMPVKRLLSIHVKSGYIGAEDKAITEELDEAGAERVIDELTQEAANRLEKDYSKSPTGRVSNALYDVRHAEMSLIVDAQQIPAVLNAIDDVNFMSVIGMDVRDIDEYEHLREGYYYGAVDSVQLDLVIETIWLRSWTAGHLSREIAEELDQPYNRGLMPDIVRAYLGMPPRDLTSFEGLEEEQDAAPGTSPRGPTDLPGPDGPSAPAPGAPGPGGDDLIP